MKMAELTLSKLEELTLKEIYALAKEYKVSYYAKLTKKELIFAILKAQAEKDGFLFMDGVLEIIPSEGFGFLRPINYSPSAEDIYISASQIRRFDLRNGDKVSEKYDLQKKMSAIMDYCMWMRSMVRIQIHRRIECISRH